MVLLQGDGKVSHTLCRQEETSKLLLSLQGINDRPESVIFINQIKDIEDNYGGKKSHFLLKLDQENIHMKCDENSEKEKWVTSIRKLMEIYKGKKILDWDDDKRSHKEEIDIRVVNIIMDEQESSVLRN